MRAERRLAAIMAADVVGYSRLMGDDEEGTVRKIKSLIAEVVRPAFDDHRGRVVKTMGDGFLGEFASVVEAFHCALRLQSATDKRNAGVAADEQIILRIGINVGDIIIDDGDVFGDGVNIAARLEAMAQPGGICVSQRAWEDLNKLKARFDDLGEQKLKNIARPIRVHAYRPPAAAAKADPAPPQAGSGKARGAKAAAPAAQVVKAAPATAAHAAPIAASAPSGRTWAIAAGAGLAALVAVAVTVSLLNAPRPAPTNPRAVVEAELARTPCAWLRVSKVTAAAGLETYELSGVAGAERGALAPQLAQAASAAKAPVGGIVANDVAPLPASRCGWIETLKPYRYAGPRRYDLRLTHMGRGMTRAELTFDPKSLGEAGAIYGVEPSGQVQWIADRRMLAGLRPPVLVPAADGRQTLNINIDQSGWHGLLLLEAARHAPGGVIERAPKTDAERQRFGELARAGAWRFEATWFEILR